MRTRTILTLLLLCTATFAQRPWTLRECIDYALANNIDIKQQAVAYSKQEIEVSTAKNRRLPDLNGSVGETFSFGRSENADGQLESSSSNSTSFGLSTSIPLFTGFEITHSIAISKLNLTASLADLNRAKEDISIQVTSSFLEVLYAQEAALVAKDQQKLSNLQLQRLQKLHEVGSASAAQMAEIKAQVANDDFALVQATATLDKQRLTLSQLLELTSSTDFQITTAEQALAFTPLQAPDLIALAERPAMQAATARLEASRKGIKVAQSAYYPQLSLSGGLSSNYFGNSSESFKNQIDRYFSQRISLSLNVPIFNRFETRNRVKTARLQVYASELSLESNRKALYKEVQQAYLSAISAQAKFTSSQVSMKATEESFHYTTNKYENGSATTFEYSDAKSKLLKATSDALQAKYEYLFRTKILDFYNGKELSM